MTGTQKFSANFERKSRETATTKFLVAKVQDLHLEEFLESGCTFACTNPKKQPTQPLY